MSIDDSISSEGKALGHQKNVPTSLKEATAAERESDRKSAKYYAVGFTILYIVLFLPFLYMGLLSSMIFDNPSMTVPVGLSIIFFTFLIPLSMPVSIYLTWSRYLRGQHKKARIFCILPIFTFFGVSLIIEILGALLRYFVPI